MREKEIQCLERLFKLADDRYDEMVEFFLQEKLLDEGSLTELKLELNKPKHLYPSSLGLVHAPSLRS